MGRERPLLLFSLGKGGKGGRARNLTQMGGRKGLYENQKRGLRGGRSRAASLFLKDGINRQKLHPGSWESKTERRKGGGDGKERNTLGAVPV